MSECVRTCVVWVGGFSWFAYVLKVYMYMSCLISTKVCVFKSSVHVMSCIIYTGCVSD